MEKAKKRRTVKKPTEQRNEMITAARELFFEKEYANTTLQDVINKLGIAKGTVYHYFKSKEELFEAVVQNIVDEYIMQFETNIRELKGNALEKIHALVEAARVIHDQEDKVDALHRPGNALLHSRLLGAIILRLAPIYARIIEQGCAEGLFQCDHPHEFAEFFLAAGQFLTDVGIYPWNQEDLSRRHKTLPLLLEVHLHAPKGSFDFLHKKQTS